jgi:hypothetical protein
MPVGHSGGEAPRSGGLHATLQSMHVQLEPWGEGDLPLLQALLGDPVMMEHLGGPESPEKIVERQARYLDEPGALKVVVDGVGAGWVGFWEREWSGEPVYEMGWSVLPGFQGRGVAAAATRTQNRLHVAGRGLLRVPEGRLLAQQRLGLRPQPLKRRSSRALPTTERLDSAIAAPAITGFSRPTAASGIAATL